jgi:hypothetical protein
MGVFSPFLPHPRGFWGIFYQILGYFYSILGQNPGFSPHFLSKNLVLDPKNEGVPLHFSGPNTKKSVKMGVWDPIFAAFLGIF